MPLLDEEEVVTRPTTPDDDAAAPAPAAPEEDAARAELRGLALAPTERRQVRTHSTHT